MKNLILALLLIVTGTTASYGSCFNGSCTRKPVRTAGAFVVQSTKKIVTAPSRFVNKIRVNRTR